MYRKNKILRIVFILLSFFAMTSSLYVSADQDYHLIRTIETPRPEDGAWFGSPLDMDGELLVIAEQKGNVGDVERAGRAYIYDIEGNLISELQAENPRKNDVFAESVDILGEYVIVGDNYHKDHLELGYAHLFKTDGTFIKLIESPNEIPGEFSRDSVGLTPDIMLISEVRGETEPALAGMVHMFDYEGNHLKTIYSPSPKYTGLFGGRIEEGKDAFYVSEYGTYEVIFPGTVYGFDYDGNHVITLQAPEPEDRACFGVSVKTSGDKIVIGEYFSTADDLYRAGKAYVYNTEGEHLTTLQSPSPEQNAQFGWAADIQGSTIVVGEFNANVNPAMHEGKVHIFDIDGNHVQTLTSPNPSRACMFGFQVELQDDLLVIGEPWAEVDGYARAGKVHIYSNDPQKTIQNSTTEEETVVPPTEPDDPLSDSGGGVPGFPVNAVVSGLLVTAYLVYHLSRKQ